MFRRLLATPRRAVAVVSVCAVAALPLLAPGAAHADWYHGDHGRHRHGWYHGGWHRGFADHRDWHGDRFRGHWR